jgi:alcohol dehydrogenase class IV
MAILNYLTTTHFDHGAIKMLAPELERLGMARPLFVTDRGVRALGALGVTREMIPDLVPYALGDLARFGAPVKPTAAQYAQLYEQAL